MLNLYTESAEQRQRILREAEGSKALLEFLGWYLDKVIDDNIFSDTYDCQRARQDGMADQAFQTLKLLQSLTHDK